MSHPNTGGLLSTYNSLTDKHLVDYFSNTRIRRHLQRAGLITRSGRIVPDKEYKHKLIQRTHQRHIRDCLAQAIFHKVLEMERIHQNEIKRNLEEFVRRDRVHRMKVERSKRYKDDIIPILSPHPPVRVREPQKQQSGPEEEHCESSESPSSSRPNTAPGKMQRPVRLKPIHSTSTTASLRRSSPYRPHKSLHENEQLFHSTMDKKPRRHLTSMETSYSISPHFLPVINNFVTPVPPVTKKKEKGEKVPHSSTVRGRRLRPTTSSSGADDPPWLRSSVHQTKVRLNMVYFGKTVHLTNDLLDLRDEVKVFQQHCGGENLCVYKGNLLEGEIFQFISRRHRGFPFSLTFYLNGLQVERLSSCCEFKHSKGSRLGGRHGHFGFSSVEGASPCYKCIIAMGLATKPTPPSKKEKEDNAAEQSADSPLDAPEMETERTEDDTASHFEPDAQIQNPTAPGRDKVRDDYEEDFEADDEGPVEEEKSPSPVKETESLVQEENASETDDDEDTVSRSGSSISSSNQEESDTETVKDSTKDVELGQPKEDDVEETAASTDQNEEPKSDETAAAKVEPTSDSAGDSTEIDISDASAASGSVNKQDDDVSEDRNNEETGHENKTEDEQGRDTPVTNNKRLNSVRPGHDKEKLAEAILKKSQCSSEPELSDTSTEEEEGPTAKDPQLENKEQEQTVEETKRQEVVADEVAQEQEESPEADEEKEEQQPPDNTESIKDEVNEVEEDEKAAEDEVTAEGDKSEEPSETQLHVDDENVAQDDKTEDPFDASKSADASENDEEKENVVVEADVHTDETGQKAESKKEDESSVLEADESAVTEATAASETMEIKAEFSEEQEALGFEEAPETDAERRQQADREDDTAASQTQVPAESPNSSFEEAAGETTANEREETTKDESNDEIKEEAEEQTSETDEQKNNEQEEEKMEINEEVHENTNNQKSEEEEQTHLNSEITDETEQNQTEEITEDSQVENYTDTNENTTETQNKEKEDADKPEAVNTENTEENVEDREGVENQSEGDNSHENEKLLETNTASEEKDDGAGKSEKEENDGEVTESENEEKDVAEDDLKEGAETSEITEQQEKSDDKEENKVCAENIAESEEMCSSEAAEKTQTVQNITEHKRDDGETAGASENSEVDAENGEVSFAAESGPNEEEGEASAEENADSEMAEQTKEEPEEATGEESTEGKDVESEEAAENILGAAADSDVTESATKEEGDDSEIKHQESTREDLELDMSEPGIKELDEKKDDEETGDGENGKKSDPEHKNEASNNAEKISEFVFPEDQEGSSAPTDDVNKLDEEKVDSESDQNPETAADGETGGAAEEASKASEEGASVLLKPSTPNHEAVKEETPETLTNKDNTDMVTNWIKMHQSSKYFETFVEPLEDLREDVLDIKVSNPDETPSTELPESEAQLNIERTFEVEEESRATAQTETEERKNSQDDRYDSAEAALQGEENHVASNEETDDVEKDQAQDGPAKETHEKTEVGSFSGSLKAENQSGEQVPSVGSDLNTKPAADESESPDVSNNAGQTDDQIRQITTLSTTKSADELGDEDVHSETFEDRFSGETRDVELIQDIQQTFSKDHLSSFSVDRALFAHTSYPLPLTSGTESGP